MSTLKEERKKALYGVGAILFGILSLTYGKNEGTDIERSMRDFVWGAIMLWGFGRLFVSYHNIKDIKKKTQD